MDDKPWWNIFGLDMVGSATSTAVIFGMGLISGALFHRFVFPGRGTSSSGPSSLDTFQRAARLTALRAQGLGRNHKLIFVVRTDLQMGKGKVVAQCCHAAVMCYQKAMVMDIANLDMWEATGAAKICLKIEGNENSLKDLQKKANELKLVSAIVRDGGHTQVNRKADHLFHHNDYDSL